MSVTIRSRLLLLVLSLLLPALAAAAWLVGHTFQQERQAHERTLRDTTRALSMVVDLELAQRAAIARMLAMSRALDGGPALSPADAALFEQQASGAMQGLSGWVELSARGRIVLDTRPAAGMQTPTRTQMPPLLPTAGDLLDVPGVRPMAPDGAAGGQPAAVVQPVRQQGATVFNVAVTILPAELQRIIDAQQMPREWVGAVLDNSQTVVARHPGGAAYAGRQATANLRQHLASGTEGRFQSVTLDGQAVTGYFNTSPQGWTFVTAMPMAPFNGYLPAAVVQVIVGALVLLALAVAGAAWVARGLVLPMAWLRTAAMRLKAGELVQQRPTGITEIDDVAGALADAATAVQQAKGDLERRVAAAVELTRNAGQRESHSQRVEALGRLTGGVAHDFNNLLGVISNSANLIQRHAIHPDLQVPVAATLRAVEMGSRLTQHLLRFAGRQPVHPRALELARWLPELLELIGAVLGKRIEVSVEVAPQTRPITVDSSELELALINLALNARDAMPRGGQVWLHARNATADEIEDLPPRDHVLITVNDDGNGMDAETVQRVFEPFFTTKSLGKGTGLGLSQAMGFCRQAGGIARLASTPGLGTTVSLLLPASDDDGSTAAASPGAATAAPQPAPSRLAGARVLMVEDNRELGDVTAALLDTHGVKVELARDAEEALQMLRDGDGFDVVLSDIVMPGAMDGVALARRLREQRPGLPVVLISGFSTALAAARDFVVLQKPCSQERLLQALEQAIHGID